MAIVILLHCCPVDAVKSWLTTLLVTLLAATFWYWLSNPTAPGPDQDNPYAWLKPEDFPPLPQTPVKLPRDHNGHPQAPLETWQLYGVLTTQSRQKIAFQLHLLALSLRPDPPRSKSPWAARRYFLGYFTRTDAASQKFQVLKRGERAVLGLAGAENGQIWIDDWSLQFQNDYIRLQTGDPGHYLQLTLRIKAPPSMGRIPANLRYYRMPRLEASGQWDSEKVDGFARLEHSWGQLPVPDTAVQVQRFEIGLRDGQELTCVNLRLSSGHSGRLQCQLGNRPLKEARLTVRNFWRDDNRTPYPVAWRLNSDSLDLEIKAVVPEQKLPGPVPIWSGWVIAEGKGKSGGEGFVQIFGHLEE